MKSPGRLARLPASLNQLMTEAERGMRRGRLLPAVAVLVVAGAVAGAPLSLGSPRSSAGAPLHSSGTEGPATYAQLAGSGLRPTLDIWEIRADGRLIFQWDGDTDATAYDSRKLTLTQISNSGNGLTVIGVDQYRSTASAWATLKMWYGVTRDQVVSTLASGTASAAPAAAGVKASAATTAYQTIIHYGSDFRALSVAAGFPVPHLTSLGGNPLMDTARIRSHGPGAEKVSPGASFFFGNKKTGNSVLTIEIARHGSRGALYAQTTPSGLEFNFPARPGCPAYRILGGDILARYGAKWKEIRPASSPTQGWCAMLRANGRH